MIDDAQTKQKILENTLCNVFENMYYMFPERIIHSYDQFSFPLLCFYTQVPFCENQKRFYLYAAKLLVTKMAKNFLGEERSFEDDELIDIFREAANVIIGNFISASDAAPDVRFQVPVITEKMIKSCVSERSSDIDLIYAIESDFFKIELIG
ncbi:MAG: chemotaxis protein CheX [Candidatus Magnetomorum sp.]|nr:chemotaxis protein CheX [Candidatus Magnetomorum sp.]